MREKNVLFIKNLIEIKLLLFVCFYCVGYCSIFSALFLCILRSERVCVAFEFYSRQLAHLLPYDGILISYKHSNYYYYDDEWKTIPICWQKGSSHMCDSEKHEPPTTNNWLCRKIGFWVTYSIELVFFRVANF